MDAVIELCDARLPFSSRNPDLQALTRGKSRLLVLNKADLADEAATQGWLRRFAAEGQPGFRIQRRARQGAGGRAPH